MDAVVHSKAMVHSIQGPIEDQDLRLERFVFEKGAGKVKRTILSDVKQEFPRINEAYTGRPYRYPYMASPLANLMILTMSAVIVCGVMI